MRRGGQNPTDIEVKPVIPESICSHQKLTIIMNLQTDRHMDGQNNNILRSLHA